MHLKQMSGKSLTLPDFIIGGAPKCGTTSLHFILQQHPNISIPDKEIHYFDADDPITHADFFSEKDGKLIWFDARAQNATNLEWYSSQFANFPDVNTIGEDSTTYLLSEVSALRIFGLIPSVKLIFVLRNPMDRAYSQYWHLLRSARIACSFEKAIYSHASIILGSTYKPHLDRFFSVFPREQIHVVIFEDFYRNKQKVVDDLTEFLGVSHLSLEGIQTWFNRTLYPKNYWSLSMLNKVGRHIVKNRYRNHMGHKSDLGAKIGGKVHDYWFQKIQPIPLQARTPPMMLEGTKAYLAQHLSTRNNGLSALLQRDLSRVWDGFHD